MNDYKVVLEAMIDNSSLTNAQKEIAKERLKINADISIEDFAKSKQEVEKQIGKLAESIKKILGDAISDKQSTQWAKQYYDSMISGAKKAEQAQKKLNEEQRKNTLSEQEKYYTRIINNNKQIYALKEKMLSADKEESKELQRQIKNLEKKNTRAYDSISQKGLGDTNWGQEVSASKRELENRLAIKEARLQDKTNAQEQALLEKQIADYAKQELEYQEQKKQYKNEGLAQANEEELLRQSIEYYEQEKYYQETRDKYLNEGKEQQRAYNAEVKDTIAYYTQWAKEANETAKKVEIISQSLNNGSFSTQIDQLKSQFQKFGLSADEAENKVKELRTTLSNMKSSSGNELVSNFQAWQNQIKGVKIQLDQAKLSFDKFEQPASDEKITSLLLRIQNFLSKNTAITKEAKTQLELYLNELNGGVTLGRWNQINQTLAKTESEMRSLNKLGLTFKDQWNQAIGSFSTWLSASTAVMFFVSKAKEAVTELKDIDTYLTEISKSNDKLTESQLKTIGADSFDTASKYGKKATDYLSGVQEASRAGYENAEAIAELSTAAQGAGDMNDDLANSYIIATDKAYDMNGSIEELTKTLDGSNNITNHNAVNMTELAEGMKVVGSQAASSQISVKETTAAIGTLVAVTQQSGSEMGNAFKGILMNLRQVTGEVDDGGDAIDEESLTKYEKACEQLGVSLSTVKNGVVSLKEPMQILKELSEEYTKLDKSDAKRANLLSAVGGKYRANALNAILENYDTYEKMLKDYEDGEGSMAEEAEKTANSWDGSLNRLSNTFNDVMGNIVNSDFVITCINLLDNVLSLINKITSALGSWGTIGVGVGVTAFVKNFD